MQQHLQWNAPASPARTFPRVAGWLLSLLLLLGGSRAWGQTTVESFDATWTTPATLTTAGATGAWGDGGATGDLQWHRNDYTTGWSSTNGSPSTTGVGGTGNYARFHSYDASSGTSGSLISPTLNLSGSTGNKVLTFYMINTSGSDVVNVFLSTDGGTTYGTSLGQYGVYSNFTQISINLGAVTSSTVKIRFTATSDFGTTDIGLDNFQVTTSAASICGTKSVGPTGDYPSLTTAFAAVNVNGICGPLVLELQSTYVSTVETLPLSFTYAGGSATNTVTVRPAAGATGLSITGSTTSTILNVITGKYFILDGRPGGSATPVSGAAAASDLTLANTNASGTVLTLTADAANNAVQHCQLKGIGSVATTFPVVLVGGGGGTVGNSNNTLQYNAFSSSSTTATPACFVYSSASLNAANTVANNTLADFYATGTTYAIYLSSAGAGWNISGNSFYQTAARTAVATTHYAIYVASGGSHTVANNAIGGSAPATTSTTGAATLSGTWTVSAAAAAYRFVGIYITGSSNATTVANNTIGNIAWYSSSGATAAPGVWAGIYLLNNANVQGNTVGNGVSVTITTSLGISFGIVSSAGPTTLNISGNTVAGLTGVGSAAGIAASVAGIQTNGTTNNVFQNKVYGLVAGNAGVASGIFPLAGTTTTVYNNLIGNLTAPASTSLQGVIGLNIGGGTAVNAYHNSIYLNNTSSGATAGSTGIYLGSTTTTLDSRNNLVVNTSTAAGTGGYTSAFSRVSGTANTVPANYSANSNNNLFYAGTPSATNLIYVEGTTTATNAQQTLAGYKAFMANRDQQAVTENPPFLSTTGSDPTFLHISTTTPTQVESGGTPIASVTTDYDGDTRNTTRPDIGADEGTFQPLDLTGPSIVFTALSSTGNTANRTLTATITDPSGISTTAPPRLFYRKGTSGAFVSALATSVSGNAYTFTFDYTAVGGVTTGDVIQYYVVAQDVPGNASSNPFGGTFTTTPNTVFQYTILNGLNGIYYVGTTASPNPARTYATLTAAASAYSTSGITGAVTFLLLDPAYTTATGETFPVAFFSNPDASATNTLTIRPNAGVTSTVTAAGSVLALASTNYVTIDGSNTAGGTTRNLTLTNSALTANTYGLGLLLQTGQPTGNQNTVVRNVAVTGGGATTNATFGILLSGADHDNVTLQNNSVTGVTTGIQAIGTANVSAGGLDNFVLTGNVVGPAAATTGQNINATGILVGSAVAPQVASNTVQNVTSAAALLGMQVQNSAAPIVTGNQVLSTVSTGSTATGLVVILSPSAAVSTNTVQTITATGAVLGMTVQSLTNPTVTGNQVLSATSSASTANGITFVSVTGGQVSQNLVQTLQSSSSTGTSTGMLVGSGTTGLVVNRNRMLSLMEANVNGNGVKGLMVQTGTANANILLSNNFVQVTALYGFSITPYINVGIWLTGTQSGINVYHNSVNMTGTDAYNGVDISAALGIISGTTGLDIRNNIFRNSIVNSANTGAKAYAIYSTAPATAFTNLDFNDYFVSGTQGVLGYFSSADQPTLAALRTATGKDASSVNVDPAYTSTTDLHTSAASLNNVGTPLAAVTTDIDGETRSTTTPDIGADEFITNLDIAAQALVSPVASNQCFTNAETVTVSITNASTTTALNFATNPVTVTVTIAGPTPATLTQVVNTGMLAANTTQNVTFATTADFSAVGTYTVTVTTSLVGDDNPANNSLAPITITTAPPRSAAFSYPTATVCAGQAATVAPTLATGATAGTFTSTAGLTINATTGVVSPATSTAGNYTVTNTLPATGGCTVVTSTATITITPQTTATFSYSGSPFCQNASNPTPTITGNTGGTFSAPAAVSINASTGVINLSGSTAGTYTVTYTVAGPCGSSSTQQVTITNPSTAGFSYATTTNCAGTAKTLTPTLATGATSGTFTLPAATGLLVNATTGVVSIGATAAAGNYTVTNTVAASGGCPSVSSTATFTITPQTTATFSYAGAPFCTSGTTNPMPTITGTAGGTFSSTTGLTINPTTGVITLSSSTPNTYTVTYTVAGVCGSSSTQSVTINAAPTANFSYAAGPYCTSGTNNPTVVLASGATAGTFTSTAGLTIAANGTITLSSSTPGMYTVTNTVAANGGCAAVSSTASITINAAPTANFSYAAGPYCASGTNNPTVVLATGATAGTFTSTAGLTIAPNGTVTLSSSTPGNYTVTNTVAAANGCAAVTSTASITINAAPTAGFSYPTATNCAGTATTLTPTLATGATAGTFTLPATTGLTINPTTGVVTVATTAPVGTYTVTNTVAAANGCAQVTSTASFILSGPSTATFSYSGSPYCTTGTNPTPTVTGTAGGTFSSTAGLTINPTTGTITLSSSTPGNYTVTYTVAGSCGSSSTQSVTITAPQTAGFSYATTTNCAGTATTLTPTLATGATAGTFTLPATTGLTINPTTGVVTVAATAVASTYTVTNTVAASGGCAAVTSTATFTISPQTTATFSYTGSPFCVSGTNPTPTVTGTAGGTFSAAPAGLTISATTGVITLGSSTAGTYTVTYTVAGVCGSSSTQSVTINAAPTAGYSYAGGPFCVSGTTNPTVTLATGATAGTFTASPSGLTIAANGTITLSSSTPGTYTVTNTVAAANGCAAVTSTASVTINAAPTAGFSYPTTAVCAGTAATKTPTLATGATAGTFTLPATTGLTINATTGVVTIAATAAAGIYTVTNTVAASGGCAAVTSTATFTITPQTTATFSYAGSPYCTTGTNPTPTITGTAGGTFTAAPAGLTINPTTGVITLSTSTAGTYTVTYTVTGTCGSSSTQSITINTPSTAGFSYPTTAVCAGTATTVTPTLATGATAGTFTLPAGTTGLTINATTGVVTVAATAAAGAYTVTNTVTSGGCAAVTSTATFTITPATTATFTYAGSSFCTSGAAVTPTITGTAGGTFTSTPAGLTLNATTGAITPGTSTPGTYTVTYTVAGTCGSSATQTVTITAPATAGFSYATPALGTACAGGNASFTPVLATGATAGTFSVSPAGVSVNPTTGVLTIAGAAAGTYTVTNTVAASGGCAAVTSTATFTVNPLPATPTLTQSGTPATGITLTSSSATGNQFYLNGVLIAGATGQTLLVNSGTRNGTYTVVVTNANGCSSAASAPVTVTVTATTPATRATSLSVYPNPTRDGLLTLELSGYQEAVQLSISNALGQKVYEASVSGNGLLQKKALDLHEFATGVYLLQARTASGSIETRRIVRE